MRRPGLTRTINSKSVSRRSDISSHIMNKLDDPMQVLAAPASVRYASRAVCSKKGMASLGGWTGRVSSPRLLAVESVAYNRVLAGLWTDLQLRT